jgi:hypothetical protein
LIDSLYCILVYPHQYICRTKYGTDFPQDDTSANHREVSEPSYNPLVQNDDGNSSRNGKINDFEIFIKNYFFSVDYKKQDEHSFELNTPLVQDIAQDPLKQFLNN